MDPCPFHSVAAVTGSPRSTPDSVITWGRKGTGPLARPPVLAWCGSSDIPGEWQGAEALSEEERERVCFLIGVGWKHIHLPGDKGTA